MKFADYTKLIESKNRVNKNNMDNTITISETLYLELLQDSWELSNLDDAGVDNWEYSYYRYGNPDEDGEEW